MSIREVILALAIFGIVAWVYWAFRNRSIWEYAVAPVSWLLNLSAFRVYWYHQPRDGVFLNEWSNVVYLHALILVIGLAVALIYVGIERARRNRVHEQ